jgi:uncharacterized protein YggE
LLLRLRLLELGAIMNVTLSIQRPYGVSVFGSSVIRVEPDVASLEFAVSRLKQRPKDGFREAGEAAQSVRTYLARAEVGDVGSSRITLSQSFRYTGGEQHFVGYTAKVSFHVLLYYLDRMEEILLGVIDAGANEIHSVDFQTRRLKEIRKEARQRSVEAAREKAEILCRTAGVSLGPVIHIEDVNPDRLWGREGHVTRETQPDDEGPLRAFDPGSIVVRAAVMVAFEIGRQGNTESRS